jgi:predicted transcriptional regulator
MTYIAQVERSTYGEVAVGQTSRPRGLHEFLSLAKKCDRGAGAKCIRSRPKPDDRAGKLATELATCPRFTTWHSRRRSAGSLGYPFGMGASVKIEVDERTADALKTRATELGVTVSELVAELAALDTDPVVVESDEIAELDRRWKKIKAGESTVPHERVVRWLRTWGTLRFRPWQDQ